MRYDEYQYLWPPRPETKSPPGMISFYQNLGWNAQVKKNGTLTLIFVRGLEIVFKKRDGPGPEGDHKQWAPLPEHKRFFASSSTEWDVFVAELLHNKINENDTLNGVKNHLYIFDQIVDRGEQLVGITFAARQKMLHGRWEMLADNYDHKVVCGTKSAPLVSVATTFTTGFQDLWKRITEPKRDAAGNPLKDAKGKLVRVRPEDEGLVFKDPRAALRACMKSDSNSSWQAKIRVPHENYSF